MSEGRPALRALAARLGVLPGYRDVEGRENPTSDATREALVTAMGHEAGDETAAARSLEALERDGAERLLEPVLVWREWAPASPRLLLNPRGLAPGAEYRLELVCEDGAAWTAEGRLPEDPGAGLDLPARPAPGYHEVRISVETAHGPRRARQQLIVAPRQAVQPEARLGEGRGFGLWANLYSLRLAGGWGHGGMRELAALGRYAGRVGASFVGINPLHAVTNRGSDFSPYSPASRLFRNPLYLDPQAAPEWETSPEARAWATRLADRRRALDAAHRIDHEAVQQTLLPVLRALHRSFRRHAKTGRRAEFAAYREREGRALRDFATWELLAERHAGRHWWEWPAALRDPGSAAVERFRLESPEAIEFRCWLQFELDRQLAGASRAIREAGCAIGLYLDLALGSSRASADTWMAPGDFAQGVEVGAPPDAYAPDGQAWGLPPFDPHRLRASAYAPWTRLLRAAFAHAGALRLDHAMGLMRLFWIPDGGSGRDGAYVAYPAEDLLGILALESQRHGALVVAEDLGTLPPELPGRLEDWGLLRSAVLYFARDGAEFRPHADYPPRALATVHTHDLAPLRGYWEGADLELRRRAGAIASESDLEAARRARAAERDALARRLRAEGWLEGDAEPGPEALRDAAHAFLGSTPCVLVGVSLDDLAGEREPVNLPGVSLDRHRSWSRRMGCDLARLPGRSALEPLGERSREAPPELVSGPAGGA